MTEIPEDEADAISDRLIYGNGYNPKKVPEDIKAIARDLVCHVYSDQYQERYLELVAAGHKDDEFEIELAVRAILAERERCAEATQYAENLAAAIHGHYYPENRQWKPMLGDLVGLLTQIDSMTVGLVRKEEA